MWSLGHEQRLRALIIHRTKLELISRVVIAGVSSRIVSIVLSLRVACRKFSSYGDSLLPITGLDGVKRSHFCSRLLVRRKSLAADAILFYRIAISVSYLYIWSGPNAFSLFSHSSFPGWSVVDVIHRRERNIVVSR